MNLWDGFWYKNLYEQADLTDSASRVFDDLRTTNFEEVLAAIHHARIVDDAVGLPTTLIDNAYAAVRDALLKTVSRAHVDWAGVPDSTHTLIAEEIAKHRSVFTTNYDLCLYWAHMQSAALRSASNQAELRIKDFFWTKPDYTFDEDTANRWYRDWTAIYYLHGALHLWHDDQGRDGKWKNDPPGGSLLDVLQQYSPESRRQPLFVSEGTPRQKLNTIGASEYLRYCYDHLYEDSYDTIVFGHSLAEQDNHIVDALNAGPSRTIAVSIHPSGDAKSDAALAARIERDLAAHEVLCFDSSTHPLGDLGLKIEPIDIEAMMEWISRWNISEGDSA
ncbi:DUF4917 family protein [Myceligenerans sp. TRM 65318]|uniref:DUF4917 family protein n=2 Tax=Myceligenerans pegani TaxID=2776917 RepID=A0ABR9MWA1_9MICO|nr:DUF4917 family protein [Myceligenerans sp. TRM 65318]MBE3017318.1 DUF4917 family protein [Myceligenerans sp. TRM 65318]